MRTPLLDGRPVRAVATDIDGTITDMARRLDWDGVRALQALEAHGIPVMLATGNVIPAAKTLSISIGTTGPVICENGGTIYWERPALNGDGKPTVQVLKKTVYGRESADEVVQRLKDEGHEPRYITSDPWRESEAALELSLDPLHVEEILRVDRRDDLYVVATGFAVHILNVGMNKASGLRVALEWLNEHHPNFQPKHPEALPDAHPLTMEEVLAIGDSRNDLEMLRECGHGAVVANAPDDVKDVARHVATRPHGAGVKEIVERLGIRVT